MAVVAKPFTFSAGAVIIASEHNSNFDTLYNLVNGSLDTTNLASNAAIVDTQLAQITTAGKVNISALTVSSQATGDIIYASSATAWARLAIGAATTVLHGGTTPSFSAIAVGDLPGIQVKVSSFSRDISTASGSQAITGVGFTPKAVIFFGAIDGTTITSFGFGNATGEKTVFQRGSAGGWFNSTGLTFQVNSTPDQSYATIASLDADGFTLTWTKQNSPTGTATINYLAIR